MPRRTHPWFPEGNLDKREEQEPSFMHRATARVALRENPSFDPRTCACGEPVRGCICPTPSEPPQQFAIRVEKLTETGIIGTNLDTTFWAADMMTAIRRARRLFGSMYRGWSFLAIPVAS